MPKKYYIYDKLENIVASVVSQNEEEAVFKYVAQNGWDMGKQIISLFDARISEQVKFKFRIDKQVVFVITDPNLILFN